jgi:hypothetical protein
VDTDQFTLLDLNLIFVNSSSWIQKLAEIVSASESYVAARLAFRSVGFFYVAQRSSYDVERTPFLKFKNVKTIGIKIHLIICVSAFESKMAAKTKFDFVR